MTSKLKQRIIELLDIQHGHLQRLRGEGRMQDAEKQKIYYDGMFTAYDYLFIGSGYALTRTKAGKHKIIKLEY